MIDMKKFSAPSPAILIQIMILCLAGYFSSLVYDDYRLMKKQIYADKLDIEQSLLSAEPLPDINSADLIPLTKVVRKKNRDHAAQQEAESARFAVTNITPEDAWLMQAPEGALPVILTGVLVSEERQLSMAILGFDNQQHSFLEGDQVRQGVKIVRIFPDRVIFEAEGLYVAQMMKKEQGSSAG